MADASRTWPGDESLSDSVDEGEATRWVNVVGHAPLHAQLTSRRPRSDTLKNVISALPESVREVLQLFDGRRTVDDAVKESPLPSDLTLDIIGRLQLLGVLERKTRQRRKAVHADPHTAVTVRAELDEPRPVATQTFAEGVRALRERLRKKEAEDLPLDPEDAFERSLRRQSVRRKRVLAGVVSALVVLLVAVAWPESTPPVVVRPSGWLPVVDPPRSLAAAWSWTPSSVRPPLRSTFSVDVSQRLLRAQRLSEQGRLREASEVLDEAVTLAPENFEAWLLHAGVRFDLGDRARARGSAERAEELMPNDARLQLLFATLAIDRGDAEAAKTALLKVLAVDPDSSEGLEAKALLERIERRGVPRIQ